MVFHAALDPSLLLGLLSFYDYRKCNAFGWPSLAFCALMSPEDLSIVKSRPRVHKHVLRTLAQRILTGEAAPRQTLLPESELCETLGIGRSSLREVDKSVGGQGADFLAPQCGHRRSVARSVEHP